MTQREAIFANAWVLIGVVACLAILAALPMGCNNQSGGSAVAPVSGGGSNPVTTASQVLARVELPGDVSDIKLPVYEVLSDYNDNDYALVIATETELKNAGVTYKVLSEHLPGADYLYGESGRSEDYASAAATGKLIYNDGRWIITRYDPGLEETLAEIGFDIVMLDETPMVITPKRAGGKRAVSKAITYDANVEKLMERVKQQEIDGYINDLSGKSELIIDNKAVRITTRHTESGEPLDNAIKYVSQKLKEKSIPYNNSQAWERVGENPWEKTEKTFNGKNIVAEMTGRHETLKKEVVVLIAHLDSVNNEGLAKPAPGADDNGSGCAALLTVARNLHDCSFDRTIRYVFTTGEEQGVLGGKGYADSLGADVNNVKVAINLDMIAYSGDSIASTIVQRVKTRKEDAEAAGYKDDMVFANNYKDVVDTYKLSGSISVIITPDGEKSSDQNAFWRKSRPAIWLLENDYDATVSPAGKFFNKYYHSVDDTLENCKSGSYYTAVVKALLGTAVHEAGLRP